MMPTVLVCCNAYPPRFVGGAELIAHQHARVLLNMGFQVVVLAGEDHPVGAHYSVREDSLDGVRIFRVQLAVSDFTPDRVNFQHRAVDEVCSTVLREYSPQVVHMHNIIGLSAGMIGRAKQAGAKVIVTVHDHWGYCFKNTLLKRGAETCTDITRCVECMPFISDDTDRNLPIRMRTDYLAYRLGQVDSFISPSRYLAACYVHAGIPLHKMRVIWNGVDVDRFSKVTKTRSDGVVRFTFIGYLGEHKGVNLLLQALGRLGNPAAYRLNIVGEGHLRGPVEQELSGQSYASSVRFWGKVDNAHIESVFRETDVLILPSIWPENQPVSITEAMATRTPVIASETGGVPELVEDGVTGYLFQAGDLEGLVRQMRRFLDDPTKIPRLGRAAFSKIRARNLPNQVNRIVEVYRANGARV